MAFRLSDAWNDGNFGPFEKADGKPVTLVSRFVENGFVKYKSTDGTSYHASGRSDSDDPSLEIVGVYTPKKKADKPKTFGPVLDSRLVHLMKVARQANDDVARYVQAKWTRGKAIAFEHQDKHCVGVVVGHDPTAAVVVVTDGPRKLRVPYAKIKDRKAGR